MRREKKRKIIRIKNSKNIINMFSLKTYSHGIKDQN